VKILTTGLSIGSGGSGGIFGPGMVIGGMLGAALWRLCYHVVPGLPDLPAPFVIVGMMALFGGIAHAPLAVMLMVAEMTGNLSMLAPAMLAVGISSMIVGQHTIYTSQLPTRADSPAHSLQFSFPLLATLVTSQAMKPLAMKIMPDYTLAQAEQSMVQSEEAYTPIIDVNGKLMGSLTLHELQQVPLADRHSQTVESIMQRDLLTISSDERLDEALEQLTTHRVNWAPVLDLDEHTVTGVISTIQIMRFYRQNLAKDVKRLRSLTTGTTTFEVEMQVGMPLVGKTLRDAHLPNESLVISIHRQNKVVFPRGGTTIYPGDLVTFLVSPAGEKRLQGYLDAQNLAPVPV
jgi:chloride channel protein, CIC family